MLLCRRAGGRRFTLAARRMAANPAGKYYASGAWGSGIRRGRGNALYNRDDGLHDGAAADLRATRGNGGRPGHESRSGLHAGAAAGRPMAGDTSWLFRAALACAARPGNLTGRVFEASPISWGQAFPRQSWTADKAAARLSSAHRRRKSAIAHAH